MSTDQNLCKDQNFGGFDPGFFVFRPEAVKEMWMGVVELILRRSVRSAFDDCCCLQSLSGYGNLFKIGVRT